ncbi:MAG: CehA/McbA family metallohydrolase [Anaerolineales bacterium]
MDHEYVGNLHAHTLYSDGWASHEAVAQAGLDAGLDFVITTDHNVWVEGLEGYYFSGPRKILLLTGEEVHDAARDPQKNHLLVFGAAREVAARAAQPQRLIDEVRTLGGLSFLAHPIDSPATLFHEPDLSWVDWKVHDFTGIEIWNFMAHHKVWLQTWPIAILASLFPTWFLRGPSPELLRIWDGALTSGKHWVAIGGADAHGLPVRLGPFRTVVFPYRFLFRTVNTHVLSEEPWTGQPDADAGALYRALKSGHCFVGYDHDAPSRGFRFRAIDDRGTVPMGGSARARFGVTLQARAPRRSDLRLIRNGDLIRHWPDADSVVLVVHEPGSYRVEARLNSRGRLRPWIFSNPITITR